MSSSEKLNIFIAGNPHSHPSAGAFLEKFVDIIHSIGDNIILISGDKAPAYDNVHWINPNNSALTGISNRYLLILILQIYYALEAMKHNSKYDSIIILAPSFIVPSFIAKLMGKRVSIFTAQKPGNPLLEACCRINFLISDALIIESINVLQQWNIDKLKEKAFLGSVYVNTGRFKNAVNINLRRNIVGYLGNLEERKGVTELIQAIPIIGTAHPDMHFVIAGCGALDAFVKSAALKDGSIEHKGFVASDELMNYYNSMKLLVLPSRSEGLPNVLLEAMACGTPVLATRVGSIPDIITDGINGFLMDNNTPECIAENIIRALRSPCLESISKNAMKLIEKEFTRGSSIERYMKIFCESEDK